MLFPRSLAIILTVQVVCGLFAEKLDFDAAFDRSLEQNIEWKTLESGVKAQSLETAASRKLSPTMTLQVTPGVEGFTTGTLLPPEFPLSSQLRLDWPLWKAGTAKRLAAQRANEQAGLDRLRETRADLKAEFLAALAKIALAREIAEIRRETENSFGELKTAADRRVQLGAGNTKDSQRAAIAALQAHTSAAQAERQVEALWALWATPVRAALEASAAEDWKAEWSRVLETLGVKADFSGASFPQATPRTSVAARVAALDADYEATLESMGASISAFGALDGSVKLATDLTVSWLATGQAGLVVTLPVLVPGKTGTALAPLREKKEVQQKQLELELNQQEREVRARNKAWQGSLVQLDQRRATYVLAQQYAEALRTELASGTSTLETVLGGLQLKFRAQEDEATARWEAVAAAVSYLKVAGGLR